MAAIQNLSQRLMRATASLQEAGIETARLDAEVLLAEALGMERMQMLLAAGRQPQPQELECFEAFLERRRQRVPIAYILGHREFWSLDFKVTRNTLIPRPDSETLVQAVLAALDRKALSRQSPLRLLDMGTGSGCLLLALLSELPNAWGLGIDYSLEAVRVARGNAATLGLGARAAFMQGDWAAALDWQGQAGPPFDLIVSNPPYIAKAKIETLAPEVRLNEPLAALAGGADGLAAYQALAPQISGLLAPEGTLFLEIGIGQEKDITRIMARAGVGIGAFHKDFGGIIRCLEGNANKKCTKT